MTLFRTLAALATALFSVSAHAIEEPDFKVLQQTEVFEVRQYAPFLVAQVLVPGPANEAGNQGFSLLGGYIFGKNKGVRKLEMTAPVTQTATTPVKLEMTAPVTQSSSEGGFIVQFVMPKGFTLATLPEPLDPKVMLREVHSKTVAVIRYSGSWSQSNYDEQLEKLSAALAAAGIKTQGEPVFSRYNGPFTLPMFRRNEIWLTLL